MYLGVWWNPFSWGQDFLDGVVSFVYGLFLSIDCIIYSFVSYVYQIFLVLAQGGGTLLDDKFMRDFVNRIYIIIGVVMLFIIAYALLKAMINPDDITKSKNSPINIVKDVIISIALVALIPTIFEFAFQFQNSLLINNTIGKLIVGTHGTGADPDETIRMGGYNMASGVFSAFFHANEGYCNSKEEENNKKTEAGEPCKIIEVDNKGTTFGDLWDEAKRATTFWALARSGPSIVRGEVSYYILIAPAAGVFVLFVLLSYCLDMALRLVKLAVYELIAPLPIFSRIIPNEQTKKVFDNWLKATLSTFTEVFIRIAIMYFAVLLISTATASINNIFTPLVSGSARLDILLIAQALIIIGIIMFVKQAPGIIKEITGLDGSKYNVFGSAMKGFNAIRSVPKTLARSFTNTEWDKKHKFKSALNKFKNPLFDMGSALLKNHEAEYKGLGDIGKNYDKITTESLSERRRKEAIRKAKQNTRDRNKAAGMFLGIDWKEGFTDYIKGSADTKAIEEKIKLSDSVGKDIKSKIIDEAIDKNLKVKQLDNAWKALQNKAVDAGDYFERVTSDNYLALGLSTSDIGSYYDAATGAPIDVNTAQEKARIEKQKQEGALKSARDKAAFETMYGALKGDWSVFDDSDIDAVRDPITGAVTSVNADKTKFLSEHFSSMLSQFNTDIEYAKAKNKDIASDATLRDKLDMASFADADAFKSDIGKRKLAADTLTTGYNKDLAEARSREQLKAETKGDSK